MPESLSKTHCSQFNFHWCSSSKKFAEKQLLWIFLQNSRGNKWRIDLLANFYGEACLTAYLNKTRVLTGRHFFRCFKENLGTHLERNKILNCVFSALIVLGLFIIEICNLYLNTLLLKVSLVLMSIQKVFKPFTGRIFYQQSEEKSCLFTTSVWLDTKSACWLRLLVFLKT